MPVPRFANPADYFMKLLSITYPKTEEDIKKLTELNINYNAMRKNLLKAENR